jgi:hypothetical protein
VRRRGSKPGGGGGADAPMGAGEELGSRLDGFSPPSVVQDIETPARTWFAGEACRVERAAPY